MKFCDKRIQEHLLNGGIIKKIDAEHCYRKIRLINNELCFVDGHNEYYRLDKDDLTTDGWKIVEPEYNWAKIIADKVLCVFSYDKDDKDVIISTLAQHDRNIRYFTTGGYCYSYCKPFNPSDFNIAKDSKEYEK